MLRKILAMLLVLLLFVSLTGCLFIPAWEKIDMRYDPSEIASVELYDLTHGGYSDRFHGTKGNIDQMEEDLDPIATLDAEQYEAFVRDLEDLTFTNHFFVILVAANDPIYTYYGYTLKITYLNGDYDIISRSCQLYDKTEKYEENNWHCDEDAWNGFINSYFSVGISTYTE